jgi:phage-related protein
MKKEVLIHITARSELSKFSELVRNDFEGLFVLLMKHGRLNFPDARKINRNLFEMRIKREGEYRGMYAYVNKDSVVVLYFFRKKTTKTPLSSIKLAYKRLKDYE